MKNILYIGPYRQLDGWGEAARSTLHALLSLNCNITARPLFLGRRFTTNIPFEIIELEYNCLPYYDVVIQHTLPHLAVYKHGDNIGKNILKTHIETSSLKYTSWLLHMNLMDEVWVNSSVEKRNLVEDGIDEKKIQAIPQSCSEQIFEKDYSKISSLNKSENTFLFYFIGEFITRKGLSDLLFAYLSEFTIDEDVMLLIKTSGKYKAVDDLINQIKHILGQSRNNKYYPNVGFITDYLDDEHIMALHSQCSCFVMPSYGESFCIPAITSMLFGKTPIVTANTGMTDYVTDDTGWVVKSNRTISGAIDRPLIDLYTGYETWEKPDLLDLKLKMREAYSNQSLRQSKSKNGIAIRKQLSHQEVGKQIGQIL